MGFIPHPEQEIKWVHMKLSRKLETVARKDNRILQKALSIDM